MTDQPVVQRHQSRPTGVWPALFGVACWLIAGLNAGLAVYRIGHLHEWSDGAWGIGVAVVFVGLGLLAFLLTAIQAWDLNR